MRAKLWDMAAVYVDVTFLQVLLVLCTSSDNCASLASAFVVFLGDSHKGCESVHMVSSEKVEVPLDSED